MRTICAMLALAALAQTGCAPAERPPPSGQTSSPAVARIGGTARLGGVAITPLEVIEDSRCPRGVTCIWAGRVRIRARIDGGARQLVEMESGKLLAVGAGRRIMLTNVSPERIAGVTIEPGSYRFTFAGADPG